MQVFDRIDPHDLERREWHLWLLVLGMLGIFAAAIILLMYPSVFLSPLVLSGHVLRKAFFGFCVLSGLLLTYLTNRQIVLARTRKVAFKNQEAILQAQSHVAASLLGSLPDLPLFQARLRAEFKRAALGQQPFSVVLGSVQAAVKSTTADNQLIAIIVGSLKRKLRRDDLIYLLAPHVFCILLPGVTCENAARLRERMVGAFNEARVTSGLMFETKMLNYPEQTKSLHEYEEAVCAFAGVPLNAPRGRSTRNDDPPSHPGTLEATA